MTDEEIARAEPDARLVRALVPKQPTQTNGIEAVFDRTVRLILQALLELTAGFQRLLLCRLNLQASHETSHVAGQPFLIFAPEK